METEQAGTTRKRKDGQTVPSREEKAGELIPQGKLFSFRGVDDKWYSLTLKQKIFCQKYVETMGNGVQSAMAAYHQEYKVAKVTASENLTKPNLLQYLATQFMMSGEITPEEADAHLAFLVRQFADLSVKARAVDMALRMFGKYAPEKVEHSVNEGLEKALDRLSALLP